MKKLLKKITSLKKLISRKRRKKTPPLLWILWAVALTGLFIGSISLSINLIENKRQIDLQNPQFKRKIFGRYDYSIDSSSGQLTTSLGSNSTHLEMQVERGKSKVKFAIPLNDSRVKEEDNSVIYQTTNKLVSVKYQPLPDGIKEEIILTADPQTNIFVSNLSLNKTEPRVTAEGQIVFVDQQGEYQFHILPPFAQDAVGDTTYGLKYHLSEKDQKESKHEATYITTTPNSLTGDLDISRQLLGPISGAQDGLSLAKEYQLVLEVDPVWMNSPDRVYPIIIDPTVVHDTSTEFATGELNRITDTGSGSSPVLETYYQELPADEHTVGLWHMDEASGNALDSSENGNDGTPTGTTVVSGKINNGRSFNGTSDYVDMGDITILDGATQATISVWVNPDTIPGVSPDYNSIISKHAGSAATNSYFIRMDPSDGAHAVRAQFSDGSATISCDSVTALPIGQWTLVTAVLDSGDNCYLYFNDELMVQSTNSSFTSIYNTTNTLKVGYSDYVNDNYFDGTIDEVYISNVARTHEEVKAAASRRPYSVYTSEVIDLSENVTAWNSISWDELGVATGDGETLKSSTSLVGQWNFNETSGTTADNAEGTAALDGTLSGFDSTASQDADPDSGWTADNRRWGAGALQFDGVDSTVDVGNDSSLQITGNITVESWIKTSTTADAAILSKFDDNGVSERAILFGTNSSGQARFSLDSLGTWVTFANIASTSVVTDGNWHHIVGTYDGSTVDLYVDGIQESSVSYSSGIYNTPTSVEIGSMSDQTEWWFDGTIDSTRIYSRAISAAEVLSNYNSSDIQIQTRVGSDSSPDDGSWDAWAPVTGETAIKSFDSDESSSWGYRKDIAISHTGTAVTEYQVLIEDLDTATLITNGKLQADCDDLRFTNTSGDLINHYLLSNTCNTADTKVWVQVDSIPASGGATFYMFYGNPAATSYSSDIDAFSYSSEKDVAYILHSAVTDLEIISLANNNSISHNGTTVTLDKYKTDTGTGFGGGTISQFSPISAKAPFNADDDADNTDSIVPISFAGTESYFYSRDAAESVTIWAIAPWGTATVTVYGQGTAATGCTGVTVATTGSTLTCTSVGQGSVRISSDVPIIAFAQPTAADDQLPVYPVSNSARIGGGTGSYLVNGNSTLDYSYYYDTAAAQQNPADLAADGYVVITGGSTYGVGAMLVQSDDSNQNFGFTQVGDGDGGDGHTHVSTIEQSTVFGSANQADYISIASTQPATCTVYEASSHSSVGSGTATSSNTEVYFLGFGTGNTTVYTTGAWYMECDAPVSAHFQDETQAEENLIHPTMNRQFTYPTPSVGAPGSESTLTSHTGSWIEMSADDIGLVSLSSNTIMEMEGTATEQIVTGQYQGDADTAGLWHFEETGGTGAYLQDSSGNGNHATPVTPTLTQGISGKARDFDGTDDYVQLLDDTAADALGTDFSISAWFKSEAIAGDAGARIFARDCSDFFCAYIDQSATFPQDLLAFIDDATAVKTFTGVIDAGWNHLVMTWDTATTKIYLNGTRLGNYTFTGFLATDRPIIIGDNTEDVPSPGSDPFDGPIDEVMISNKTLSYDEVSDLYRMGRDRYINKTISSTDLSGKSSLPFYVASDRPGTYLDATVGESAYANYQPDANTVGLWHFEEKAGLTDYFKDSSGWNNHADPAGGVTNSEGKIGNGKKVDAVDGRMFVANSSSLSPEDGDFTISAWLNSDVVDSANRRAYEDYGSVTNNLIMIRLKTTNVFESFYRDGAGNTATAIGTTTPIAGQWYHVTAVRDGTSSYLYVNGKLESVVTNASLGTIATSDGTNPTMGRYQTGANQYWDGSIDEVHVSNIARTATEIRQAYEVGLRTHPITIDFAATLDSGNLITGSGDLGFTIDATAYGLSAMGSALYKGDKVIVRENYDGTEYIAQGTVTAITQSTGAVTVTSWDAGGTFPSGGYTADADVFKWQREYWPVADSTLSTYMDGITKLSLRLTNGNEGRTIWLDDLSSTSGALTDETGSTITSSIGNQYFQYRVITTSVDEAVSASFNTVTLDYSTNDAPTAPTALYTEGLTDPTAITDTTPEFSAIYNEVDTTDIANKYQIQVDDDSGFASTIWDSGSSGTSMANCSKGDRCADITYAGSSLVSGTTYYWRIKYWDDDDTEGAWSAGTDTFIFTNAPTAPTVLYTEDSTDPANVIDLTPEFSAIHNDGDGDSADYYQVEVNTASDFTGTVMWDSTQTSMTTTANGVRSPDISYAGTALSLDDTTYYWRVKFWDVIGAEGVVSATANFGMNILPTTPTLDSPTDTAGNQDLLPTLRTTGTDTDSDYLRYKIELCEDVGMSVSCQTFDQTSSQTGWSGQDTQTSTAYASGTQGVYTLQSILAVSTTYYWRSYAIDPGGANSWSSTQGTPYSFSTDDAPVRQSDCRISEASDDSQNTILWTDTATNESFYAVARSTDGGAWSTLSTSIPADSTSYVDSTITAEHTYYYRVAPYLSGPAYGEWCYTDTLTQNLGSFRFD